jgi:hypothetical protein
MFVNETVEKPYFRAEREVGGWSSFTLVHNIGKIHTFGAIH